MRSDGKTSKGLRQFIVKKAGSRGYTKYDSSRGFPRPRARCLLILNMVEMVKIEGESMIVRERIRQM